MTVSLAADAPFRASLRAAFARASAERGTAEPLDRTETPHPTRWRFADGEEGVYDWRVRETGAASGISMSMTSTDTKGTTP